MIELVSIKICKYNVVSTSLSTISKIIISAEINQHRKICKIIINQCVINKDLFSILPTGIPPICMGTCYCSKMIGFIGPAATVSISNVNTPPIGFTNGIHAFWNYCIGTILNVKHAFFDIMPYSCGGIGSKCNIHQIMLILIDIGRKCWI